MVVTRNGTAPCAESDGWRPLPAALAATLIGAIVPPLEAHGMTVLASSVDASGLILESGSGRLIRITWMELDDRPMPLDGYPTIFTGVDTDVDPCD